MIVFITKSWRIWDSWLATFDLIVLRSKLAYIDSTLNFQYNLFHIELSLSDLSHHTSSLKSLLMVEHQFRFSTAFFSFNLFGMKPFIKSHQGLIENSCIAFFANRASTKKILMMLVSKQVQISIDISFRGKFS